MLNVQEHSSGSLGVNNLHSISIVHTCPHCTISPFITNTTDVKEADRKIELFSQIEHQVRMKCRNS